MNHEHTSRRTSPIPVLVDNGLNRAFGIKYFVYALFGFTGIFTHIPSLEALTGAAVAQIVAICVFVSSLAAGVAAWNFQRGIRWMKAEVYSTYFMISFVLIYNAALVILTLNGDTDRLNLAVLATALLVMPIWRVRDLIKKGRR
jgi:uncharacterized membrane protein YidH (DUF202 family)